MADTIDVQTKGLPLAEWMELYDQQPIEVVDGEVVPMSPPGRRHASISDRLFIRLNDYLRKNPIGKAWSDGVVYILDGDDRTDWVKGARVPDVSFISQSRMDEHDAKYEDDGPWRLAPDLAVEIISPHDKYTYVNQKVADYLHYGTLLVWVIDPRARTIRVHSPADPDGHTLRENETLSGDAVLPNWEMPVKAILDGEKA